MVWHCQPIKELTAALSVRRISVYDAVVLTLAIKDNGRKICGSKCSLSQRNAANNNS
jgi:hypothetical protein